MKKKVLWVLISLTAVAVIVWAFFFPIQRLVAEIKYDEYRKFTSRYSLGITKNMIELTKFVNNKCFESFGDGNTKTITNDWLREYKNTNIVSSPSDYNNMLDSRLMFEQVNSNDTNTMKCSFKVNRPIVTTDEQETTDYIKKW